MKLKYSPESISDLQRLYDFLVLKSPLAAKRVAIEMQEATEKLKSFPRIGLPVSRASEPEAIRDLYIGNYTVRYQIYSEEVVYILRIWHNKESEKDL